MFSRIDVLIPFLIFFLAKCWAESENNIHLLKAEIEEALQICKDGKETRQITAEEYEKAISRTRRGTNNKQGDYDSEEWDYGVKYPKSWDDSRDDKSIIDSGYGQKRRNDTRYSNNYNRDKNLRDRNNTRYNNEGDAMENVFDSRGAKFGSSRNGSSFIETFMNNEEDYKRKKRFDRLVKVANENECLSQCVFTNIKVVDDRGIPKESLFVKLIQDSITSQQSRLMVERQIQKCFKELANEPEDNGCVYCNILERCMGLQLHKRKIPEKKKENQEE